MDESAQKCLNIGPDLVLFSSFMHSYLVSLQFSRASNSFPHVTSFALVLHEVAFVCKLSFTDIASIRVIKTHVFDNCIHFRTSNSMAI